MTLGLLTSKLIPPKNPIDSGKLKAWHTIEEIIGVPLPRDYKEYINTYGTGKIWDYMWIFNPFTERKDLSFPNWRMRNFRHTYETLGGKSPDNRYLAGYSLYPEKDGLLICGETEQTSYIFWKTQGHPNNWTIVLSDEGMSDFFEEFDCNLTEFIRQFLDGKIETLRDELSQLPRNFTMFDFDKTDG